MGFLRCVILRFLIERFIPALTGGYTYYKGQPLLIFWIHTFIFAWSFFIPLILVHINTVGIASIVHPLLILLFWFIIKLIKYKIHLDFDKQVQNEFIAHPLQTQEFNGNYQAEEPPLGISKSVWRIRDHLPILLI